MLIPWQNRIVGVWHVSIEGHPHTSFTSNQTKLFSIKTPIETLQMESEKIIFVFFSILPPFLKIKPLIKHKKNHFLINLWYFYIVCKCGCHVKKTFYRYISEHDKCTKKRKDFNKTGWDRVYSESIMPDCVFFIQV